MLPSLFLCISVQCSHELFLHLHSSTSCRSASQSTACRANRSACRSHSAPRALSASSPSTRTFCSPRSTSSSRRCPPPSMCTLSVAQTSSTSVRDELGRELWFHLAYCSRLSHILLYVICHTSLNAHILLYEYMSV